MESSSHVEAKEEITPSELIGSLSQKTSGMIGAASAMYNLAEHEVIGWLEIVFGLTDKAS